ncbi:hypothetical protein OAT39_00470 [Candidatus Thioglobus sp.]|nr:hypothetical protein [Candidatus Thioglobus sp.]
MSIAFTSGESSGICPDIVLIYTQQERHEDRLVCNMINEFLDDIYYDCIHYKID